MAIFTAIEQIANVLNANEFTTERDKVEGNERITFWGRDSAEYALVNNEGNLYLSSDVLDVYYVGSVHHKPSFIANIILDRHLLK